MNYIERHLQCLKTARDQMDGIDAGAVDYFDIENDENKVWRVRKTINKIRKLFLKLEEQIKK